VVPEWLQIQYLIFCLIQKHYIITTKEEGNQRTCGKRSWERNVESSLSTNGGRWMWQLYGQCATRHISQTIAREHWIQHITFAAETMRHACSRGAADRQADTHRHTHRRRRPQYLRSLSDAAKVISRHTFAAVRFRQISKMYMQWHA